MTTTTTKLITMGACALAIALVATTSADAAPINYGDFTGTSVMYLDVTETAITPDDDEPLFGGPSIVGNSLEFDPAGFAAVSTGGLADFTDGQLNFTLMGVPGAAITAIEISEGGDYDLLGTGSAATQIAYALALSSVKVFEVDGVALGTPITLGPASASGGDNLGNGIDAGTPWSLGLAYDVNVALANAGIMFDFGATKLEIALDNTLFAASELLSGSLIAKKDFMIDVHTEPFDPNPNGVPEPSSLALVGLALCGVGSMVRRQR